MKNKLIEKKSKKKSFLVQIRKGCLVSNSKFYKNEWLVSSYGRDVTARRRRSEGERGNLEVILLRGRLILVSGIVRGHSILVGEELRDDAVRILVDLQSENVLKG